MKPTKAPKNGVPKETLAAELIGEASGKWEELPDGSGFKTKISTGEEINLYKGKGKHVRLAQRLIDGNPEKYQTALMSLLLSVNGKKKVLEDMEPYLDELPMTDYTRISTQFAKVNFL